MRSAKPITIEAFKELLKTKQICRASLDDVWGTHHQRDLYRHPNSGEYFVRIK